MKRAYFQKLENCSDLAEIDLRELTAELPFDTQGLQPVITQDASSKEVLMLAWMNKTALEKTLETGYVTYWSRSRNEIWVKGATSGHTQELVNLSIDCDGDAILCLVKQTGAACHTGRRHCFYLNVDSEHQKVQVLGGD